MNLSRYTTPQTQPLLNTETWLLPCTLLFLWKTVYIVNALIHNLGMLAHTQKSPEKCFKFLSFPLDKELRC